jgi:hypothetical protein
VTTPRPTQTAAERRAHRAAARAKLASLRERLRQALASKKLRMRALASTVRSERLALRERLRTHRKRTLEELRAAARAEHEKARADWRRRRLEAKEQSDSDVARARAELAAERAHKVAHQQIDRAHRADTARHARGVAPSQSDDEVRALLAPELVPLFNRVTRSIRGSARETRAEAFLRYAEKHPEETFKAVEPRSEEQIQAARTELAQATRAAARGEAFTLSAIPAALPPRTPRARRVLQQTLDLDATLWSTLARPEGPEATRGGEASRGAPPSKPQPAACGAADTKEIEAAHTKIRKLRRALENQERRFERGDYGKATRAEAWAAMAKAGEQIKAAEEIAARAESTYRTRQGRDHWEAR